MPDPVMPPEAAGAAGLAGMFTEMLVGFAHALRRAGLSVGTGDVLTYVEAMAGLDPTDLLDLYWGGRATLVSRRDDIPVYTRVFREYFLDENAPAQGQAPLTVRSVAEMRSALVVPDTDSPRNEDEEDRDEERQKLGFMASDAATLKRRSFSLCTDEELAALRRIMARMRLTPPRRRTRRHRPGAAGRAIDIRKMARESMRTHGEPTELYFRVRKTKLRPLVLILDVSGSMADYSRHLLQFAHTARRAATAASTGRVEVFCFGTRLTRITRELNPRKPDAALEKAAEAVVDWDGGTRIGESLEHFVRRYGRGGMARGAVVIICSDGLDRGAPQVLADAMERLHRLCYRIVWLNPHKGDNKDFQPNTLGMMVAEPNIDLLLSGHDLASLEELANMLPTLNLPRRKPMQWSVGVEARCDRVLSREEIVELADAVAPDGGIASGIGTDRYGAQMLIEAETREDAVEEGKRIFLAAAATAGLPEGQLTRARAITEEEDALDDESDLDEGTVR